MFNSSTTLYLSASSLPSDFCWCLSAKKIAHYITTFNFCLFYRICIAKARCHE